MLSGATGASPARPKAPERAADRQVVDVVPGPIGERTGPTPSGHPAIDQPGVAGGALVWAEPEPLGHAGPIALDEDVGALDEAHHDVDAVGLLEVDGDGPPPPIEHLLRRGAAGTVDADDVGTHVGQHHPAERDRSDARQLDHTDAEQRTSGPVRFDHPTDHRPDDYRGLVPPPT